MKALKWYDGPDISETIDWPKVVAECLRDNRHVWDIGMPFEFESKCWCGPFIGQGRYVDKLVFHRVDGNVFHEYGEQGPQPKEVLNGE